MLIFHSYVSLPEGIASSEAETSATECWFWWHPVACLLRWKFRGLSENLEPGEFHSLSWFIMVLSWFCHGSVMVYHGLSWFIMVYHGSVMVYHGLSWFIMVYHGSVMVYHGSVMVYHGLSWFCHGLSWFCHGLS